MSSRFICKSGHPTAKQCAADCRGAGLLWAVCFLQASEGAPPKAGSSSLPFFLDPPGIQQWECTFLVVPCHVSSPSDALPCPFLWGSACLCCLGGSLGEALKSPKPGTHLWDSDLIDFSAVQPGHGSLKAPWGILIFGQGWVAKGGIGLRLSALWEFKCKWG